MELLSRHGVEMADDVKLLLGDCLETLKTVADASVQCCVTSPPYYGLRDYGVAGQIGLEETPEAYVAKLVAVFQEVKRVLKDDGTLWLNLGDSYAGSGKGDNPNGKQGTNKGTRFDSPTSGFTPNGCKPKDLIGIPWMVAFALRANGWWLRSDIIWAKPNPMPESVTDRCTKSHEYIFLLTKSARYYYDADAIKESANYPGDDRKARAKENHKSMPDGLRNGLRPGNYTYDLNYRNKRSVWTVTTKPYKGAHFATYPPDLIEPCILAGTSEKGECPKCGKAWIRVTERQNESNWEFRKTKGATGGSMETGDKQQIGSGWSHDLPTKENITLGWKPQCHCVDDEDHEGPLIPVPQTVLDPFNGSGTTGEVALKHHRNYIGCELNPAYIELTNKRLAKVQPTLL